MNRVPRAYSVVLIPYLFTYGSISTQLCPTLATPWTVALKAPLSLKFSRREYESGSRSLRPGDFSDPEIEPRSPAGQEIVYLWATRKRKVKVKSLSRVQLCDPMGCNPPGSSIRGIFQARVLEWGAIAFSRGSSRATGKPLFIHNSVCMSTPNPQFIPPHPPLKTISLFATSETQFLFCK